MNTKRGIIILTLVLLRMTLPISFVYGNVPSVLEVESTADGSDTVLILEISHSSPSSNHYVDSVEVKADDGDNMVYDQDPQSSTRFSVEIVLEDTSPTKVEVRSHCTNHGWSTWKVLELEVEEPEPEPEPEEEPETPGEIPGFGFESILIGVVISMLVMFLMSRRISS
jgi:desulfoferrodoxin (superoxide reductase-like protein)